jgi:hypothetical protein
MAKRKAKASKRRSYGRKMKRTVRRHARKTPLIITAAAVIPTAITAYNSINSGQGMKGAAINNIYLWTGFDASSGTWDPSKAQTGMYLLGAVGVSIVGRKLGLNKYNPFKHKFNIF